jgi:eukaryotic-like serine/threonine-protein kinase
MSAEREELVFDLLEIAADLDPSARQKLLDQRSAEDTSLQHDQVIDEVRELLEANDQARAKGFLQAPLILSDGEKESQSLAVGQRLDGYEILSFIGAGGMGEVYRARDEELNCDVAIKLVKGGFRNREAIRRFRQERRILGQLKHPNIAGVHKGGETADGAPYLVMEYVCGKPVTEYATEHELSINDRLKLFQQVCAAVAYAHQRLVIHRDIKPSNILVTESGTPKLLDFGIAKLFDPTHANGSEAITNTVMRIMTPEYASPEQVRFDEVTTASDVYSLGVLLYELLTGHRPYRFRSRKPDEVARVICEQEPQRPSASVAEFALRNAESKTRAGEANKSVTTNPQSAVRNPKSLKGDLDNIILKALRKEPARRYASVSEFSEDIRRHLEGLPVTARKDTFTYRASKFVGRNKIAVAAAIIVSVSLIGGIIATASEARVARAERTRAERRFNDVRRMADSFMFELNDEIEKGPTKAREMLVKKALEYLDNLAREAGGDPSLRRELATAYLRVGDIQGRPYHPNLGQTDNALTSYRKALAILGPLATRDSGTQRDLATIHERIGNIQLRNGQWKEAQTENEEALRIRQDLLGLNPTSAEAQREVADSYLYVGDAQQVGCIDADCGRKALASQREALEIRQTLAHADATNSDLLRDVAQASTRVGFRLSYLGKLTKDEQYFRQALESQRHSLSIRERLAADNPINATDRRNVADEYMLYADAQLQSGDTAGAFANYRRSLEMFKALRSADPYNNEAERDLCNIYLKLAGAWKQTRKKSAAIENYRLAAGITQQLLSSDPNSEEDLQVMSAIDQSLTEISINEGNLTEAIAYYSHVVEMEERLAATTQTDYSRLSEANSYERLAGLYASYLRQAHLTIQKFTQTCQEALGWHQKYLDVRPDLISKGLSLAPDPAMSPAEIVRCEQEVSK